MPIRMLQPQSPLLVEEMKPESRERGDVTLQAAIKMKSSERGRWVKNERIAVAPCAWSRIER